MSEIIPSTRRTDWTIGTRSGVPGGMFRFLPGGANDRTTIVNAVATYSADNTGATDTYSQIQSAIDAATAESVVYLPPGLYKISVPLYVNKSNITLRGAGSYTRSSSTVSVSTGTKTFTVASGLGYTTGCGVRAWQQDTPENFVQGTVMSYSGTTLVVDVTRANGSGAFSTWKVSRTMLLPTGTDPAFSLSNGTSFSEGYYDWGTISGDVAADQTVLSIPGASSFPATGTDGRLVMLVMENPTTSQVTTYGDVPVFSAQGSPRRRLFITRVTGISGDNVTIDPPCPHDMPARLSPIISYGNSYPNGSVMVKNSGVEGLAIHAEDSTCQQDMCGMYQCYGSWLYDVESVRADNRGMGTLFNLQCEIRKCWIGSLRTGGSNHAALLYSSNSFCLNEDNVLAHAFPTLEANSSNVGCVWTFNYSDGQLNTNHNAHNSFSLYEFNVCEHIMCDGYHGGGSNDTYSNNFLIGDVHSFAPGTAKGWIVLCRATYYANCVGNVMGIVGVRDGGISTGNAYFGGAAENGGHVAPVAGTFWPDYGIDGTIATRTSDEEATITLASAGTFNKVPNYQPVGVTWSGGWRAGTTVSSYSDPVLGLANYNGASGSPFPAVGTSVKVWPGPLGYGEHDDSVLATLIDEGNYSVTSNVPSTSSLTGTHVVRPGGYARSGTTAPADWWDNTLSYPPISYTSPPSNFTTPLIPAMKRALALDVSVGSSGGALTCTSLTCGQLQLSA